MKGRALLAIALALVVTGCATSKLNYIPPSVGAVDNQVSINGSFDSVWDRLVKNLASDFFVINNIEKTSRIINVSFSSNTPPEFISCGVSSREFSNARGTQKYEYDPASSTQYTFTDKGGLVFNAVRAARLNGRANVYVAPSDDGNTLVSVNTKYVVDVTQSFTNVYGQPVGNQNFTFDFSTKQPQVTPDGVTCVTKGNLEQMILDYAK